MYLHLIRSFYIKMISKSNFTSLSTSNFDELGASLLIFVDNSQLYRSSSAPEPNQISPAASPGYHDGGHQKRPPSRQPKLPPRPVLPNSPASERQRLQAEDTNSEGINYDSGIGGTTSASKEVSLFLEHNLLEEKCFGF